MNLVLYFNGIYIVYIFVLLQILKCAMHVQKCISTVLSSFNIFWHKCLVFAQTKQVPLVQTNLIIIYPKKSFHFQKRQKFILLFFVWYLTIKTLLTKTGFP